ncbi:MAG TPA: hypothetical protein VJX67_13700 [Blastocatellia bacterium]|nr:hypothetical protein [Blastocatellia bacterium]
MVLNPVEFGFQTDEQTLALADLSARLNHEPEEGRFQSIEALLKHPTDGVQSAGLKLLVSSVHSEDLLARAVLIGFDVADASWMKTWIRFIVPRLGFPRTFDLIRDNMGKKPRGVSAAIYWLGWLIAPEEAEQIQEYLRLKDEASHLGVLRDVQPIPVYDDATR